MKSKILIGIIIAILIAIGIGVGFNGSSETNVDKINLEDSQVDITNSEGTQFTLELSDSVTASGP